MKKIWYVFVLLVLLGVAQAQIPTTLNQSVTPQSGTARSGVKPTFSCMYYANLNGTSQPVTGAIVFVVIDSGNYSASYYDGAYHYSGTTLYSGNHNWYCIAGKAGYQFQMGSPQVYTVLAGGGGGGGGRYYLVSPIGGLGANIWTLAIVVIAVIGIAVGYFVVRGAMFANSGKRKK
ncbi:MAG: hypothetical protein QXF56_04190 [Candidatus Micrarchaeia archaeon]